MKYRSKFQLFTIPALIGLLMIGCDSSGQSGSQSDANTNGSDSLVVELTAIDSTTPLQLLLDHHQVEYRGSIMGSFVTAIDSVENSSSAFWIYTVNDTTPKVACDRMSLGPGDRLKWHYRRVSSEPDSGSK